jgi:hypothetical protein
MFSTTTRLVMSTALAFGCAVSLQAQAPTSAQTNRAIPGEITVTGCVERADQMAAATTAGTAVDSLTFMLIHAEKGTADEVKAAGTSGAKDDARGTSYRLDADVPTLNPHVGHKVEVTGTLDAPAAPAAKSVEPPGPASAPRLKVDHVKMVSETCAR